MPLGEIAGELVGGAFRVVGNILAEVVFEVLIKGAGYLACRPFSRSINPDGWLVVVVGLGVWCIVGFLGYASYQYLTLQLEIDSCLDSGGSYDYAVHQCQQ